MSSENKFSFEERYPDYYPIRDEDIGKLYAPKSHAGPLALKLYNWVGDLSEEQRKQLKTALADLQRLNHPSLLRITHYQIDESSTADRNRNYIEYAATTFVALDQWPAWPFNDRLHEAAALIIELASTLTVLHRAVDQKILWLRPILKPETILITGFKDDKIPATLTRLPAPLRLIVSAPGLAALLTERSGEQRSSWQDETKEIKALGQICLQLLRNPTRFGGNIADPQEIEQALGEVAQLYSANTTFLQEFFRRALNPHLADSFHTIAEMGDALRPLAIQAPTQRATVLPARPVTVRSPTSAPLSEPIVQQRAAQQPTQTLPSPQPALVGVQDQLVIDYTNPQPGEVRLYHDLTKDVIVTLGNSSEDTIRLGKLTSARRLMVLHQNGQHTERYVVTDSGHGISRPDDAALLDGLPLSPYFAAIFHENSVVEIAGYRVSLALKRLTTNPLALRNSRPLQVAQTRYAAAPGSAVQIQATILNVTNEVDRFWISVDGVWDNLQFDLPEPQRLFQEGNANVKITVYLPAVIQSSAGETPLILRLISENYRVQIAALRVYIKILPHYDFISTLLPETLRLGNDGELEIENLGNLTRIFEIQWRDRAQELDFVPHETMLTAPAQSVVKVTYRAYIRKRQWRLLGGQHFHPMNVLVNPRGGGVPQTLTGQVVSRALIPGWVPIVALLMVLLFLFAASFLFQPEFASLATVAMPLETPNASQPLQPTTWIAVPTPVAGKEFWLLWQPVGSCFYSVYENETITSGPNFTFASNAPQSYKVQNLNEGTVIQVRLRSCMLLGERSKQVIIQPLPATTPIPTATMVPSISVAQGFVVYRDQPALSPTPVQKGDDGVTRLLVGQTGEFCFTWQTAGVDDALVVTPTLQIALTGATGEHCLLISETFREAKGPTDYALVGMQGDHAVVSPPFARIEVRYPICRVNIDPNLSLYLAIREGPGRNFPERGQLRKDDRVVVLARPFKPMEQEDSLEWLLIALSNDPRPAWVAYRELQPPADANAVTNDYLDCPQDIVTMPDIEAIPPTPTPTPTTTPQPTLTPTATPASDVSLEPPIVNPGGCATLKWKIENVKEIYLNEQGVIGEGEQAVCPSEPGVYTYEWKILKIDGTVMKVSKTLTVNPGPPGTPAAPTPPE